MQRIKNLSCALHRWCNFQIGIQIRKILPCSRREEFFCIFLWWSYVILYSGISLHGLHYLIECDSRVWAKALLRTKKLKISLSAFVIRNYGTVSGFLCKYMNDSISLWSVGFGEVCWNLDVFIIFLSLWKLSSASLISDDCGWQYVPKLMVCDNKATNSALLAGV